MANQEQSAEEIFAAALDVPPEERSAFLARTCRGSPEQRNLVEGLLLEHQRMGSSDAHLYCAIALSEMA